VNYPIPIVDLAVKVSLRRGLRFAFSLWLLLWDIRSSVRFRHCFSRRWIICPAARKTLQGFGRGSKDSQKIAGRSATLEFLLQVGEIHCENFLSFAR